jgi:8-oxo-dGTP pyrophosphatase MutT (NUDIX family)
VGCARPQGLVRLRLRFDPTIAVSTMPMSDYIRGLRAKIGTTVLEIPTVSVLVFDDRRRVLLARHAEGNDWTTPGGMIEPYETPSNAAVREMWEETGLHVALTRIIGVFGGELCTSTYGNGDKLSWVSTVFAATPIGGTPKPDGEEILELRYVARGEVGALRCKPHVHLFLDAAFARRRQGQFQPPTWQPPGV